MDIKYDSNGNPVFSTFPTAHASTHENGGSDEIDVTGLSGLLADPQTPLAHAASHQNGGADEISVTGLSGLLADPQTPIDHASEHEAGGGDEIDHAALINIAWTSSGHTGAADSLGGWDGLGDPFEYAIPLDYTYGGTGLDTLGGINTVIHVNDAGDALEYVSGMKVTETAYPMIIFDLGARKFRFTNTHGEGMDFLPDSTINFQSASGNIQFVPASTTAFVLSGSEIGVFLTMNMREVSEPSDPGAGACHLYLETGENDPFVKGDDAIPRYIANYQACTWGELIAKPPLHRGVGAGGILLVGATAYALYLGKTERDWTPTNLYAALTAAGVGAQTAEFAIYSSPTAPDGAGQTLTRIQAVGTVTALTSTGVKTNITTAFSTLIPAGTHVWGVIRTDMATTEPTFTPVSDFALGNILTTAGAAALTAVGSATLVGALPAFAEAGMCPSMMLN